MGLTATEKMDAEELRQKIFERDGWKCAHCGKSVYVHGTPMLCHRIAATKANLKKYGAEIIHHSLNMLSGCSIGICNDSAMVHGTVETEELVDQILEAIDRGER